MAPSCEVLAGWTGGGLRETARDGDEMAVPLRFLAGPEADAARPRWEDGQTMVKPFHF